MTYPSRLSTAVLCGWCPCDACRDIATERGWRPEPEPPPGELVPDRILWPTQPDLRDERRCADEFHVSCGWTTPEDKPKHWRGR